MHEGYRNISDNRNWQSINFIWIFEMSYPNSLWESLDYLKIGKKHNHNDYLVHLKWLQYFLNNHKVKAIIYPYSSIILYLEVKNY